MGIEIIATGRALPERRVANGDLPGELGTSDAWIRSHTGIAARRIAEPGLGTSELAARAAAEALGQLAGATEAALKKAALSLDLIVAATTTPDYPVCPSTACLVQERLGAKNAAAFDINAGCTGFIYALECAAGLLAQGRRRALVAGADLVSRVVDWHDRSTCVLFGDGAGAVILENAGPDGERGILGSFLAADGSGAESLVVRRGGSKAPGEASFLEMNGRAVYNFAVKALVYTIGKLLADGGFKAADLAWIVPHQANARIIAAAAERLGLPVEKFFVNIAEYANTSSASIPIALDELNRRGLLERGSLILTAGFGAGLTYGGNIIRW
jgi:3-oxoacyl-[acyl-carrier-protein] synthase-3